MEHFHVALADVKQERKALLAASLLAVHPIQGRLLERRAFSPRDHTAHLPTASKEAVALPEQPVGLFVEHKGAGRFAAQKRKLSYSMVHLQDGYAYSPLNAARSAPGTH